jgi:hypothetical protein
MGPTLSYEVVDVCTDRAGHGDADGGRPVETGVSGSTVPIACGEIRTPD